MSTEIELKLVFPPAARAELLAHPLLAGAERVGSRKELINTYYDTPDLALSAQRVALRTRKSGTQWLQTVKCAAESVAGLSSRPEWEQAFSGEFDFAAVTAAAPRALLERHREAIVPLFSTDFQRDTLALSPREGVRILAMIDCGEISAAGRSERIHELELELVSGTADDLLALACELAASLPLLPYDPSKAARGYRLFRNQAETPLDATPPRLPLHGGAPLAAFRHAAFQALAAWSANLHGALNSADPEYVHQQRQALRSLRSLIRLFSAHLPKAFVSHWQSVLRSESRALDELRELDVLVDDILNDAREGDSDTRLPALFAHAEGCRQRARQQLQQKLAAPAAGLPLLELNRALHALPVSAKQQSLAELAARARQNLHKKARQRLKQAVRTRQPASLHALRLAIKRLRHAQHCFSHADDKPAAHYTARLGRLLSRLGRLHDLSLAMPRLSDWAAADPALTEAVAFVAGWQAATSLKLRRTILPRCKKVLADQR